MCQPLSFILRKKLNWLLVFKWQNKNQILNEPKKLIMMLQYINENRLKLKDKYINNFNLEKKIWKFQLHAWMVLIILKILKMEWLLEIRNSK